LEHEDVPAPAIFDGGTKIPLPLLLVLELVEQHQLLADGK
jgi:hypothetical protein